MHNTLRIAFLIAVVAIACIQKFAHSESLSLYVTGYAVQVGSYDVPLNPTGNTLLPIPAELGWTCGVTPRLINGNVDARNLYCSRHGSFAQVTAACVKDRPDIDLQRLTIGDDKPRLTIRLACLTAPMTQL